MPPARLGKRSRKGDRQAAPETAGGVPMRSVAFPIVICIFLKSARMPKFAEGAHQRACAFGRLGVVAAPPWPLPWRPAGAAKLMPQGSENGPGFRTARRSHFVDRPSIFN